MTPAHPMPAACPPDQLPECQRAFARLEERLSVFEIEQRKQGKDVAVLGAQIRFAAALGGLVGGVGAGLIVAAITHAWK